MFFLLFFWGGLLEDVISDVNFSQVLKSTTHHRVQIVSVMYQESNPFTLVKTGILGVGFQAVVNFRFSPVVKFIFSQRN